MIVSYGDILKMLGKVTTVTAAETNLLNMVHPLVESAICNHVGYDLCQGTRTEYYPSGSMMRPESDGPLQWDTIGNKAVGVDNHSASRVLQLTSLPLRSVTSIYEDPGAMGGQAPGAFPVGGLLTSGVDYYFVPDKDGLCRSGQVIRRGAWPQAPGSIKVTYVSGYTAAELLTDRFAAEARLAVLKQMQHEFSKSGNDQPGAIQSESLADYSVTYAQGSVGVALTEEVKGHLRRFVSYARYL